MAFPVARKYDAAQPVRRTFSQFSTSFTLTLHPLATKWSNTIWKSKAHKHTRVSTLFQVLTPSSGLLDFAISMRPDYHRAIIDTVRYYGWKKIIYLYDSHDGKSPTFSHAFLILQRAPIGRAQILLLLLFSRCTPREKEKERECVCVPIFIALAKDPLLVSSGHWLGRYTGKSTSRKVVVVGPTFES